jgi:hypothetical protein
LFIQRKAANDTPQNTIVNSPANEVRSRESSHVISENNLSSPRMDESPLEEYNGFLVDGSVTIAHPNCTGWQSLGTVYSAKTRSPLVQVVRIEGQSFDSQAAAIKQGLELARQWVDALGIGSIMGT